MPLARRLPCLPKPMAFFGFLNDESFATMNCETRNRVEIPIPNRRVVMFMAVRNVKKESEKRPLKILNLAK